MDITCPHCNKDIDSKIDYVFWDVKTICPYCLQKIIISFDFYMSDDYEEFPVYNPKKDTGEYDANKYLDFVKSVILE